MSSATNGKALYENLDTALVNLWSLLRNQTQRGFVGRVRVELKGIGGCGPKAQRSAGTF